MNKRISQAGFGAIEVLLILVLVGIIGFVGWRVYEANREITASQNAAENSTATPTETPAVNQTSDLDTVDTKLDETNVDGNTSKDLETQLNF